MAELSMPSPAACPGCLAAPPAQIEAALPPATLMLSLPGIHCQMCIRTVEEALQRVPGVTAARVNLTLRRASVEADAEVTPDMLIRAVQAAGHEAHELDAGLLAQTRTGSEGRDLLMRMAVAGFASMNVMLLSVAVWSGATDVTRDLFHWISAAIALPAIGFAAQPFFRNAIAALRARQLNMDVPITLAIVLALGTSLWETGLSGEHAYFDAALTLTFFLLAGRWLEARARAAARSAAEELTALEVPRALRMEAGEPVERPIAELVVGDILRVRPGGRIPVDGVIVTGVSELDRSLLTGETMPVVAQPGHGVSAGEVNLSGPLEVRATAVGRETSLHRIADLVAVAESGRANYTSLADRAAKLYAPGVHILSALAFIGWLMWSGDLRVALNIAAAVLIITCPCALGLAVPAVTTAASGRLFARGLLIKEATALERLSQVDTVVLDKTGTLTTGQPRLVNWTEIPQHAQSIAKALAQGSSHPLSRAVLAVDGPADVVLEDLREVPGFGTEATFQGSTVRLGRPGWSGEGDTPVEVAGECVVTCLTTPGGVFTLRFEDDLRDGAAASVAAFQDAGLQVVLLSGDRQAPVSAMAQRLGITTWHAGMLPGQKAELVSQLQISGKRVLMVGDGLNDTGALAVAHVSIAPATALDAARVASDIVMLGGDLSVLPEARALAQRATSRIAQNFRIATLYNVIAVPLAVAGLATPLIAALAMSASSICVSLNALRLGPRP